MTPECDDRDSWTKPSLERITVLGDGSFAEILPARAEKFGELYAVTMLMEAGPVFSGSSILLYQQALGTLHVSAEELHRFLLRFRPLGEKIAQGIPSAANLRNYPLHPQAVYEGLETRPQFSHRLVLGCRRRDVASCAGPPSHSLGLQLQQTDTFRRRHRQTCYQRQCNKSVWSFQFMNTVVSKPLDIRIEVVHPLYGLHVTFLKWSMKPAARIAPVVRKESIKDAIVWVAVFVRVVFCEPLELASQLCGLLQQVLESRGPIVQNSVYTSSN